MALFALVQEGGTPIVCVERDKQSMPFLVFHFQSESNEDIAANDFSEEAPVSAGFRRVQVCVD